MVMDQQTFASPPRTTDTTWTHSTQADGSGSLGELFSDLTSDLTFLMRKEIELARTEITEKLATATRSAALMVAGGLVAYAGFLALLAAIGIALGGLMPYWLSAMLVGIVVLVVGAILIQSGRSALQNLDVTPEKTVETLKENTEMVKEKLQ
jgi:hypothetical protein